MPVTLIFKSLKRPSWLCSQTGTRMCPFLPAWSQSGGAPQTRLCSPNGINRPGIPRTPVTSPVGTHRSPPLVTGLLCHTFRGRKDFWNFEGRHSHDPFPSRSPRDRTWDGHHPSAPLPADGEACDKGVEPGGSGHGGLRSIRSPSPWQTDSII